MEYDPKRIEETVRALLATFSFDGGRSWKGYDFDVMNALRQQGLIDDPRGKNKSVWLTAEGLEKGTSIAERLFTADSNSRSPTE
ncbi:hypothetical protein F471_02993 [Pseudomonas sp. URMO17WK12:I1]|uniref:DUF6429 family protein n=1 Tax=unclassified Pseudomonas TaxID=196821 RepID=UPI000480502F|nr:MULTISPECIES: DUF6429 family protein [unclassified Pseudomonas]PZW67125.1 hypothetical protein F471_02993 [Pseudomonas sp. URMO17WK12:I1]